MRISVDSLNEAFISVSNQYENEVIGFAATELQRYLERMTGAKLPITHDGKTSSNGLVISLHVDTGSELPTDAFRIAVAPGSITLQANAPRGVLYATYALLEQLGCRWVHPGEAQEIVPRLDVIDLPVGEHTEIPHIEHRGLALYGLNDGTAELGAVMIDWMAKNRLNLLLTSWERPDPTNTQTMFWHQVGDRLLPELKRRGILLDMSEHSTEYFFPRSLYSEHPEWFALNDGKRMAYQMCYSNMEGVEYFGQRLADFAAAHPEIDILGAWPMDGAGYCECEDCQKPDAVFKATVRMGEMVRAVRPDITIEHLAYRPETLPVPKVEIPEWMSVLVCNRTNQLARDWVQATKNKQGTYYFEYKMADQYHWATNVWLRPDYAADITRTAIDIGFRGIVPLFLPMHTWWQSSLNVHVYARNSWDPNLDVAAVLDDYCQAYYGEAAQQVRPLLSAILNEMQVAECIEDRGEFGGLDPLRSNPDIVARTREIGERVLAQLSAVEAAAVDKPTQHRLQQLRTYVEYFILFYDFRAAQDTETRQAKLDALSEYAEQHADDSLGVCTTPEFVRWRLRA